MALTANILHYTANVYTNILLIKVRSLSALLGLHADCSVYIEGFHTVLAFNFFQIKYQVVINLSTTICRQKSPS